jgi:hypothetical protein
MISQSLSSNFIQEETIKNNEVTLNNNQNKNLATSYSYIKKKYFDTLKQQQLQKQQKEKEKENKITENLSKNDEKIDSRIRSQSMSVSTIKKTTIPINIPKKKEEVK